MSTWISRLAVLALATLTLAGCDEATGLPFAAEFGSVAENPGRSRMAQVPLSGGQVVLSVPDGYCIDRQSLRRLGPNGFALVARCDTVGVRGFFGAHDLAVMTVTTVPQKAGRAEPTPRAVAASAGATKVLDQRSRNGLALVRLDGGAQTPDGVSPVHWRGAFTLNGHLVGIALYAPEGSSALKGGGAALITDLAERTRKSSMPPATATAGTKPTAEAQ